MIFILLVLVVLVSFSHIYHAGKLVASRVALMDVSLEGHCTCLGSLFFFFFYLPLLTCLYDINYAPVG